MPGDGGRSRDGSVRGTPEDSNPYRVRTLSEELRTPGGARLLKLLALAFALYTVLGHVIFYGRVLEAYHAWGAEGIRLYFGSGILLTFLSFFGALCVVATFVYTFRRPRIRPVIAVLIATSALVLGLAIYGYFAWADPWVRLVISAIEVAQR